MPIDNNWCAACRSRVNFEEADLSKEEKLSLFDSKQIGRIHQCRKCGLCYEEWEEDGVDGVFSYRHRLTWVETVYALQDHNDADASALKQKLMEELDETLLTMAGVEYTDDQNRLEWQQLNLIHYYHAKHDVEAIAKLRQTLSSGIAMAVQCHLMDPPLLTLK